MRRSLRSGWPLGCSPVMETRQKLQATLERYYALLRLTTDPEAIAALEELIRETRNRLDELPDETRSGEPG